MKFVEMQGKLQSRPVEFSADLFFKVVRSLLVSAHLAGPLLALFTERFLSFDDVRYHTCRCVARLLDSHATLTAEARPPCSPRPCAC
jgi:hypothetical protein